MEGKITQTQERLISNQMEFPQVLICAKNGFKADALAEMGYPDDILTPQTRSLTDNYEFDAESVWEKGTYSNTELAVNWRAVHGNALFLFSLIRR